MRITEPMDFFSKLRSIREDQGLDLEDIARQSRMQIKILQAIESGDLQQLPAAYDHLFFRAYLKALELNEEEYMEEFYRIRNQQRNQDSDPVIQSPKKTEVWNTRFDYNTILKSKNLYVFMPFALVLVILIILLSTTRSITSRPEESVKEIDVQSIAASLQPPVPVDTVDSLPAVEKKLNLVIQGLRSTWFRIVTDKKDTAEYMLKRGNQFEAKAAQTFEFIIGRADGLQFRLNEKPPQTVSTDSLIVSYLLIDSSGIAAKRFKQPKPVLQADSTADSSHENQ
jgi:cytoskeleton protein RodZ